MERNDLLAVAYDELRALAAAYLRGERRGHTLQPTALVHEAYMRLAGRPGFDFESKAHFVRTVAKVMRQVLIDHANARAALKRGGGRGRSDLSLADPAGDAGAAVVEVLALDEALQRLERAEPRHARVVELRFFRWPDQRRGRRDAGLLTQHRREGLAGGEGVAPP